MNIWTFTGRLTRDCEQRFLQSGKAICSFSVAVEAGFGENKTVNYPRCALFGARAEGGLPQYLKKGAQVAISGELKITEYDNKDGVKCTSVDVNVDKLDLIGGRNEGGQQQGGQQQAPARNTDPFNDAPIDEDMIPF